MTFAVSVAEAKAFLRLDHDYEDAVIETLIAAAQDRIQTEIGSELNPGSSASLRLSVMILVAQGFEDRLGGGSTNHQFLTKLLSPHRQVRL
jgi:uncharacterized phage protein (predicted DNA packaging)